MDSGCERFMGFGLEEKIGSGLGLRLFGIRRLKIIGFCVNIY